MRWQGGNLYISSWTDGLACDGMIGTIDTEHKAEIQKKLEKKYPNLKGADVLLEAAEKLTHIQLYDKSWYIDKPNGQERYKRAVIEEELIHAQLSILNGDGIKSLETLLRDYPIAKLGAPLRSFERV